MLARLVQLTRSLYPAAGTVTEDDDSSIGRCVTPHASLAKSVVQPPLRDQVHLIRPHAFRYHAGGCCSLRQTTTPRSVKPYHSPLSPNYTTRVSLVALGLHMATMFLQQQLVIRRCLLCARRVIVPPSCKGQHYAQRPLHTTFRAQHHLS
jgi:hypothetical protein